MDQRLDILTLGVDDVPRARAFYERLGCAVGGPAEVDALCDEAAAAGATITRAPVEKPFGYSGVFADLDGHTWEVAWIKGLERRDDGSVALPS